MGRIVHWGKKGKEKRKRGAYLLRPHHLQGYSQDGLLCDAGGLPCFRAASLDSQLRLSRGFAHHVSPYIQQLQHCMVLYTVVPKKYSLKE